MTRFSCVALRFFYLAALFLSLSTLVRAAETLAEITEQFRGEWDLVSYVQIPARGEPVDMNYVGRLSYDAFGNMVGIGMPRDLAERNRDSEERVTGGFAYWGKVSFDLDAGTVIHHVEGSPMVPEWLGQDNVRFFEFTEGLLKLSLKNAQGRVTGTLTWRRLP